MGLIDKFKKKEEQKENKIDIENAFIENLKYISNPEKNVNDIKKQFVKTNTRYYLTIGEVNCPTGKIIVSDPLAYLVANKFCETLEENIPIGTYPVEVAICRTKEIGIRMATIRMKIKSTDAIEYKLATSSSKNTKSKIKTEILSGFPVDAGMVSICDKKVAKEYQDFIDDWYKENPNKNHYDDYFANFFKESEMKYPQYQREEGDFIEWKNPKTNNKLVMIASGFGDGYYQSYWGYDSNKEICELIIPLINPDLFEL